MFQSELLRGLLFSLTPIIVATYYIKPWGTHMQPDLEPVWRLKDGRHAKSTVDLMCQIFLTGYIKSWESETDQCDTVSWNYWQNDPETGSGAKMTKDLRRKMKSMVDSVNNKLRDVVAKLNQEGENRVFFVDVDNSFNGHRFCEDGITEPQKGGEDRTDTWMFQYQTPTGQAWNPNDTTGAVGWAVDWAQGAQRAYANDPSLSISEYYADQPLPLQLISLP